MSSQDIRFDIITVNSGATAGSLAQRLQDYEPSADPVVIIRRQLIDSATWHRIGLRRLLEAIEGAVEDRSLSELVQLDAANQVEAHAFEHATGESLYGVLLLDEIPIAFSEGLHEAPSREPRRSVTAPPSMPPPRLPEPRMTTRPRPAEDVEEPTETVFRAFPDIHAPITVRPDEEFEVSVGVSAEELKHTVSEGLTVSGLEPGEKVHLQVLVTGPFYRVEGSENLGQLIIDPTTYEHQPFVVRFTTAEPPETFDPQVGVWVARVTASYFHEGSLVGDGYRDIRVNQVRSRQVDRASEGKPIATVSSGVSIQDDRVDLTISLSREDPGASDRFHLSLFSKHLPEPRDGGSVYLGRDAREFASSLIKHVHYTEAPVADETLNTIGRIVAETVPAVFHEVMQTVWNATAGPDVDESERRVPDVLLLTDDWAVPWELMSIEFDKERPPFLGAQVNIGRWPHHMWDRLIAEGLSIRRLGVMIGKYGEAGSRATPLPRAADEGEILTKRYDARLVDADPTSLDLLLAGRLADGSAIDGIHFAGHGESDPTKDGTYLMYSDGRRMSVLALGSAPLAKEKDSFMFVNACEVGTADVVLGKYLGLAGLAILAGFRGFVAPLWRVDDERAMEISLGMYEAAADGIPISSYMRVVREDFRQTDSALARKTDMAYMFYGHPLLQLGGPDRKTGQ